MGKLSRTTRAPRPALGTLRTRSTTAPDTTNSQGFAAYSRDVKSELFALAVTNFVGEETFHESAQARDARFLTLIHQATQEDPEWTANLLYWLRSEGNMRSASIVGAVEYGRVIDHTCTCGAAEFNAELREQEREERERGQAIEGVQHKARAPHATSCGSLSPFPRKVLAGVLQRADEPGEAFGYWVGNYGRPLPKWLKKGLGDAAARLYSEYSAFKYDGQGQPVRFADVIEMSQTKEDDALWKWLLARRHNREENHYDESSLTMLAARRSLDATPVEIRRAMLDQNPGLFQGPDSLLRTAGYTWEALSGWIQGPMDAKVWEAIIPSMGYMALLRNLRNFDETGVSDKVAQTVIAKLTDPAQVAKSRQLPFRFLSAYKYAPSDRWKHALGQALDLCFGNIPQLGGKTLILIDGSNSMTRTFSAKSTVAGHEQAALFGIALAKGQAQGADIVLFSSGQHPFELRRGAGVLSEIERLEGLLRPEGTDTITAVNRYAPGHDRIVVVSDEQQNTIDNIGGYPRGNVFASVPDHVPCYTVNVAGYADAHAPATGVRHGLAGLTDSVFRQMAVLELRQKGQWPWDLAKS